MTVQEHQLMIAMFGRQLQLIKALREALKSHGILERGDFAAFISATTTFAGTADGLIDETEKVYRETATQLGIDLPKLV